VTQSVDVIMDKWKVIQDMTRLTMKYDLHKGAHVFKVLAWCEWAVNSGHVEYVYEGDTMIGFMDWITSNEMPVGNDYQSIIDTGEVSGGKIAIALNCCVTRGKDTLKRLIKMARQKNKSCQIMCWHDRKMSRMRYFSWHPHKTKEEVYAT
jgi:hypothetical protein